MSRTSSEKFSIWGRPHTIFSLLTFELHNVVSHMCVLCFYAFEPNHCRKCRLMYRAWNTLIPYACFSCFQQRKNCVLTKKKMQKFSSFFQLVASPKKKFYFYDQAGAKESKARRSKETWKHFQYKRAMSENLQDFLCKFSYVLCFFFVLSPSAVSRAKWKAHEKKNTRNFFAKWNCSSALNVKA